MLYLFYCNGGIMNNTNTVRKPARWIVQVHKFFLEKKFYKKYNLVIDKKALEGVKPPFILLFNHVGFDDHLITGLTIYPLLANFMVVRYVSHTFPNGPFSRWAGAIYKNRYIPDAQAVLESKRVLRDNKGILAISPAACYSIDGTPQYWDYAAAKLIKQSKVPVYMCRMDGMYFLHNRFRKERQIASIKSTVFKVFNGDELTNMTQEEIHKALYVACDFNDFQYQEQARMKVGTDRKDIAVGMEYVCYKCPSCGKDFVMRTKGDKLFCEACGNAVRVDEYYQFVPENENSAYLTNINTWNGMQRKCIEKETAAEDFSLSDSCTIIHYKKRGKYGTKEFGRGVITLDKSGFTYKGSDDGKEVEHFYPLQHTPSIGVETTAGVKDKLYIVFDGQDTVDRYKLDDMRKAVKFQQALQFLRFKYCPNFEGELSWHKSLKTRQIDTTVYGKPQVDVYE